MFFYCFGNNNIILFLVPIVLSSSPSVETYEKIKTCFFFHLSAITDIKSSSQKKITFLANTLPFDNEKVQRMTNLTTEVLFQ